MNNQKKRIKGFLLDIDSKEIISESMVDISLIPPLNPGRQPSLIGTMIINRFKPQFHDKQYLLKLSDKTSGKIRITMQPVSMLGTKTLFDIWFEDPAWHSSIDWFEAL